MILIAIALFSMVPIGLMSMAYIFKKQTFGFFAAGIGIVVAGLGFTQSEDIGDLYFIIGFLGVGMLITFAMLSVAIQDSINSTEEPDQSGQSAYERKYRNYGNKQETLARATMPRSQYHSGGHSSIGMSARRKAARERRQKEADE